MLPGIGRQVFQVALTAFVFTFVGNMTKRALDAFDERFGLGEAKKKPTDDDEVEETVKEVLV